ncbi:MAG TPA: hypothetical protein VI792_08030 [Candidatus Eisenbacteria bacterium]
MIRLPAVPRTALAAGVAWALALGLASCSKKVATVDPGYVTPEGAPTPQAKMVVNDDLPVTYLRYIDRANDGLSLDDSLDAAGPYDVYAVGPGAIVMTVLDSTAANGYELMRRESNGGYRVAQKFTTLPARRWLDTGWEAYSLADPAPSGYQPPTYVGRGLFSNIVTTDSPLTNTATVSAAAVANLDFDYQGMYNQLDLQAGIHTYNPPDSVFNMRWSPVPGAAGYWISIFEFTGDAHEALRSRLPAPVYLGKSRDSYLCYVPGSQTSYTIGGPATILRSKPILNKHYYRLRITAVDAAGTLLAYTFGQDSIPLPGGAITVEGSPHNTWNVTLPYSIQLRPGPQLPSARGGPAEFGAALPLRTRMRAGGRGTP